MDLDAAADGLLALRHDYLEDAVSKAGVHLVDIDRAREAERALELANRAFRDPVLGAGVFLFRSLR